MIIDERDNNRMKIIFSCSPLDECLVSLHAMSNPDHHIECCDWICEQYRRLSPALRGEIDFFSREYANWFFAADVAAYISMQTYPAQQDFDVLLDRMLQIDDVTFSYLFLGFPAFDYSIDIVRRWLADPSLVNEAELGMQAQFFTLENVKAFVADVPGFKRRLKWVLSQYWRQCFSQHWPQIRELFEEIQKKEELVFQKQGAVNYINTIHPRLVADEERVVFRKTPEYSVALQRIKTVTISFSVFSSPHLMGNVVGDMLSVTKNISFHTLKVNSVIPEELLKVFCAGADATRLKMIRILWNSESTTKEMAEVLGLSPSTVSLHLKLLKDFELVESNKLKKFVYYRLRREAFTSLQKNLLQYFSY